MWQHIRNRLYFAFLVGYITIDVTSSAAFAAVHIQANICGTFVGPTITSPSSNETTQNQTITVSGDGEPNMTVSIVDNGTIVGMVTATASGVYALDVPLTAGNNTILAQETDGCGTSKESGSVSITYQAPNIPPNQGTTPTGSQQQSAPPTPALPLPFVPISVPRPLEQLTPPTSNAAGYPKPIITRPVNGSVFDIHQIWVTGSAQVGSMVTIFINDSGTSRVNVSQSGTFGVLTGLTMGKNAIKAVSREGSLTATSDTVNVSLVNVPIVYPPSPVPAAMTKLAIVGVVVTIPVATAGIWTIHRIHFGGRKK